EIAAGAAFLVRAGGRQHRGSERLGQLDRGDADAARPALLQKHVARLEVNAVEDIGRHRAEGLWQAAGVDEADALGHAQALHRRGGGVFAVAVADQKGADLAAVTAVGAAEFDEFLTAKARSTAAAVTALQMDLALVEKLHR